MKVKSENEILLLQGINDTTKIYALNSSDGNAIPVSGSIFLNKDSLHIIGNGVTLRSDSTYKGPGFIIGQSTKYILMDSIVFENFDVAFIINNSSLKFKNVRFVNCRVPILYQLFISDTSIISGRLADSIFLQPNSPAK